MYNEIKKLKGLSNMADLIWFAIAEGEKRKKKKKSPKLKHLTKEKRLKNSFPAIFNAIEKGDLDKTKELLENNPKIATARDVYSRTPLHKAVKTGQIDAVKLLLEKDSDVNARDVFGWTPLHKAVMKGHQEITELLLLKGADPNIKDSFGRIPLSYTDRD